MEATLGYALVSGAMAGCSQALRSPDRLFAVIALGSLRRSLPAAARDGLHWCLGHFFGLAVFFAVAGSQPPPLLWWVLFEQSNYIVAAVLVSFGTFILFSPLPPQRHQRNADGAGSDLEKDSSEEEGEEDPLLRRSRRRASGRGHELCCLLRDKPRCFEKPNFPGFLLGFAQGMTSPGVVWTGILVVGGDGPKGIFVEVFVATFIVSCVVCACCIATLPASIVRSTRSLARPCARSAYMRRGCGVCCILLGSFWVVMTVHLDRELADMDRVGSMPMLSVMGDGSEVGGAGISCPVTVTIGDVNLSSVPGWQTLSKLDQWWTADRVRKYRGASATHHTTIAPSRLGGCGIFVSEALPAGAVVDVAGVVGDVWDQGSALIHTTPWAGVVVNHCWRASVMLQRSGDLLNLVATKDLAPGEELLLDFDRAARSFPIRKANPIWTC